MSMIRYAAAAAIFLGAGCVPLTKYDELEKVNKEEAQYIQNHKNEITAFERRERTLTFERSEIMKDLEAYKLKLAKSEQLRHQLEANMKGPLVVTETPASNGHQTSADFAGFRVNPGTGGIVLEHDLLFSSGSSTLKESGKKLIEELVSKLNGGEYAKYSIHIDGHTDSDKVIKTFKENKDNWELGFKRAKAVGDYMISKGIAPERCVFSSMGQYRPICKGGEKAEPTKGKHAKGDKSGKAQDRRVEIVLFEKKV
jgi:outer membrane protein OmpA-like peptidoglycan-associated protein